MRSRNIVIIFGIITTAVLLLLLIIIYNKRSNNSKNNVYILGQELSKIPGVSIKPSFVFFSSKSYSGSNLHAELTGRGIKIYDVICYAYKVPKGGIIYKDRLPEGVFDINVNVDQGGHEELKKRLSESLEQIFGIRGRYELRNVDGMILKYTPENFEKVKFVNSVEKSQSYNLVENEENFKFKGNVSDFCEWLEEKLQIPVFNETNINENIELSLIWEMGSSESFKKSLEENGFGLKNGKREASTLVILRR